MKSIVAILFIAAMTSGAEVWEGKKYKNTESKNFDEYMKAIGVGYFTRTIGNSVQPTVELKKHGDKYTLSTTSTFKNSDLTFELGKEFEEETLDGRKVKSVMTLDGNKLVHKQGGKPPSTITREFKANEMIATMKVKDVVATRKYVVEH
ncbi:probable fatty acid-binding protein [Contarinia nasturtii]|uniref:probable fatty acid-binding protein n=1 Tax=Contarinia nasturtii TaxID=265458 RepID=UPI0012D39923|nr:probable fatty acid-binding protein [Contarinia nasturtii]